MLPVAQKFSALTISLAPRGRESSSEMDAPMIWSQRHITQFPPEVLSHIFGCLGCDAVAQVQNTCQRFWKVVQANHREVFFYRQLPKLFREQFAQSRSWQKWAVKNGLHPFAAELPRKEKNILNGEHHAALVCFHTLGKMMLTSEYRPLKVFDDSWCGFLGQINFSSTGSTMTLYLSWGWDRELILLGQDGSGSWSKRVVKLEESPRFMFALTASVSFSTNGRYLSFFTNDNIIKILKHDPDSGRWQLINNHFDDQVKRYEISPSGKCMTVFTKLNSIMSIRYFDDQGQWAPMPMAEGVRIDPCIQCVAFSQSEQHLSINYEKKVVTLSLDSQGCWDILWESPSDRCIDYANFCSSGRWLLIAYKKSDQDDGSVETVRLDPAEKYPYRQTISTKHRRVIFSPSGNCLLSRSEGEQCLLWQLHKSGTEWVLCGDPGAAPLPALGATSLFDIIKFSPCGNYLFVSSRDKIMKIWKRDEQGCWMIQSNVQHDGKVTTVEFSRSGVHALTADGSSIRILGRDDNGVWSIKGTIPATGVTRLRFHPVAEHLIVSTGLDHIRIWELRKDDSSGEVVKPTGGTVA